jgi:hypothetical protein
MRSSEVVLALVWLVTLAICSSVAFSFGVFTGVDVGVKEWIKDCATIGVHRHNNQVFTCQPKNAMVNNP